MKLEFIDCNCQLGRNPVAYPYTVFYSPEELKSHFQSLNIVKAFCYHSAAMYTACSGGNKLLLDSIRNDSFFLPAYTLIPGSASDPHTAKKLDEEIVANDVRLFRLFPASHRYSMSMWSIERLFDFLDARELTVIISSTNITPDNLYEILSHFSRVKIILTDIGYSGRNIINLMKKFNNLYIDISYSSPDGIEFITEHFGSERIIFGTSSPLASPAAYAGRVILASISEKDKQNIAYNNIIRLTGAKI